MPMRNTLFATLLVCGVLVGWSTLRWRQANEARDAAEARVRELERLRECPPQPTTREQLVARIRRDIDSLRIPDSEAGDAGRIFMGDFPPWYGEGPTSPADNGARQVRP